MHALFWGTKSIGRVGSADAFFFLDLAIARTQRSRKRCYLHNLKRRTKRQNRAAARSASNNKFAEDISEHIAILSVSAQQLGEGVLCHHCREPIRGVMCCRVPGLPLHWACAGCPMPEPQHVKVHGETKERIQEHCRTRRVSRIRFESATNNARTWHGS